jgi:hypothetical protein
VKRDVSFCFAHILTPRSARHRQQDAGQQFDEQAAGDRVAHDSYCVGALWQQAVDAGYHRPKPPPTTYPVTDDGIGTWRERVVGGQPGPDSCPRLSVTRRRQHSQQSLSNCTTAPQQVSYERPTSLSFNIFRPPATNRDEVFASSTTLITANIEK